MTVALVPVKLMVCVLVVPLSETVRVAVSFVPDDAVGVNVIVPEQVPPVAITKLAVQPHRENVKSEAFVPEIAKGVAPSVRLPDPEQAAICGMPFVRTGAQLFTEIGMAIDAVLIPCLPKVSTGGWTQFALFPTCPLFGQSIGVAVPARAELAPRKMRKPNKERYSIFFII